MIEVKNIYFGYKPVNLKNSNKIILKDFSLSIQKGELVVMTGSSGSGKSTLAQIIAGHLRPDRGTISVDNMNVTGTPNRKIFLIHQENDLFPWVKTLEQITLGFKTDEKNKVEKARQLLKLVRLDFCENLFPNQLSGGMKKRLAIARALAVNPELLILDESFNSLDSELRLQLTSDLKSIWKETQTTLLIMTHDIQDVQFFGERQIHLSS